MGLDAWLTVSVLVACLGGLIFTRVSPDTILVAGLAFLLLAGVLTPEQAFAGFANTGLLSVAILYIVAAGLKETGALHGFTRAVFGKPKSVRSAQTRVMLPVTFMSAFLNNTPIVATFLPAVYDWARQHRLSVSKLMMPLSFAAILGGACTVIGTSTNLLIHGLLQEETGTGFGFFELAWVGVPAAVGGLIYILLAQGRLLPERVPPIERLRDPREYTVEMVVDRDSPIDGRTVEDAGLRHLPGLFLVEIDRDGQTIPGPGPEEVLHGDDRLVFAGITESVVDLQKMKGLKPATDQVFKLDAPRLARRMIEAVVSRTSPVAWKTVRQGRFRTRYNAVVIAVARDGQRVKGKIGDIRLQPGDTLLLEAGPDFIDNHRNSRDFLLLRPIEGSSVPRHEKSWIAWLVLGGIVASATFGILPLVTAALAGAGVLVATRCLTASTARRSIELDVILVIAASLGLGKAMTVSGAAEQLATGALSIAGAHPMGTLVVIYALTVLLTQLITNNAAAVLMFPIALATTTAMGLNFMPFAVAIALAASAGFATPIGYQTNLMVYGPGGYRFTDFIRFGLPLNVVVGTVSLVVIPFVWPLAS